MESVDSEDSGHSPTSHKPMRLHKRRPAKFMSLSGLSSEPDFMSGSDSEVGSVAFPRVPHLTGNMSKTLYFPTLLAMGAGKPGAYVLMMWHPEGGP